jgi:hypothetical protein
VLAEVVGRVREVAEALWAAQPEEDLVAVVEQVAELRSVLAAVEAGAVVEVEQRGLARQVLHHVGTAAWLDHAGGLRRGEGKRALVRAEALTGPLAATRAALVAGEVSPQQVDVIVSSLDRLPSGDLVRRRGERVLLDHATCLDATELAAAGRHLARVVDPDGAERRLERELAREERAAHADRYLSILDDGLGGVRLRGRGTVEDAAVLRTALLPLTTPAPVLDQTTGEQVDDPHGPRAHGPLSHGARLWDALVATAQHSLDTDHPPATHGARPRLLITLDHDTLKAGLVDAGLIKADGATTADGQPLTPATVRRLACDADLVPVVLGTHSEVLDVGRTRRLVTPALWTALIARDRHCTFPACTRPPVMCHAHHIEHWADGGPTTLDNLAMLCGHHHRVIHHSPWQITLHPTDHHPQFHPPPRHSHTPPPIRHRPRRT